ncbi:hypothetical protein EKD04_017825 [Chloroflexales bacterium ZM16-3]|nr:hypothetical protein [Chloroflexales bacterium ZM16-3]
MRPIGLIVGHGYAKAVSRTATTLLPAVAAPAVATDFDTALGAGRSAISLNGKGDWIVGDDALIFAPGRVVSILDRSRYRSPAFLALARAALQQVVGEPGPLRIITGMPSAWFADQDARGHLADAVRAAALPIGEATVTVAPEAAGVYYAWLFESGSLNQARLAQTVGVIDAGYRDVNVALFQGGRYVGGESVAGGTHEALKEIKRLIAVTYRLELSLHEVDAAQRANSLVVNGARSPLPDGTRAALTRSLSTVVATGKSLWPNGGSALHAIVLGGGGATHLAEALGREFPQLAALEHPQMAGARGFMAMAMATQARQ